MSPGRIARRKPASSQILSETDEHYILVDYLESLGVDYCHVPNEGRFAPSYLAKRKRLGVKPGVPDILIFTPPPADASAVGCAIELKSTARSARLSDYQRGWLARLRQCHWVAECCRGFDAARELLRKLGYEKR